jgi:hypothetical protein
MDFGRGVLYTLTAVFYYCNPITSLDNDLTSHFSFFLLSVLTTYTYTLFIIRSGNVSTSHTYTMGAEHAVKWAAYRLTATVLE